MIQPNSVNPTWIRLIKILSPVIIVGAIVTDVAIAYRWTQSAMIPKVLIALGAVGSVALITHAIESVFASSMAKKRGLNPWRYGIYTFLVGTVAFIDLFEMDD